MGRVVRRVIALCLVLLGVPFCAPEGRAAMIDPLFRQWQRVGVLCAVSAPGPDRLDAAVLCGRAAGVLRDALRPEQRDRVVTLAPNDERIVSPGTLVVAIHAAVVPCGHLMPGCTGDIVALSLQLVRPGLPSGQTLLFPAAPVMAAAPPGQPAALDEPLRTLLGDIGTALRNAG